MNNYTIEQLQNLKICSGCKKAVYVETKKICEKCMNRGKEVRTRKRSNDEKFGS